MTDNKHIENHDGMKGGVTSGGTTEIAPIARSLMVRGQQDEGRFAAPGTVDLTVYIRILLKHRLVIAGAIIISTLLTLIGTLMITPRYRAMSTMEIDRNTVSVVQVNGLQANETNNDADFFLTQYELLRSRSLANLAVTNLGLASDPAFTAPPKPSLIYRLAHPFGQATKLSATDMLSLKKAAADKLLSNLTIDPIEGSRIVRLYYSDTNPRVAQEVVNGVTDAYIARNLQRRYDSTDYARKFLQDQLAALKIKLEDSERALVDYATKQQIVSSDGKVSLLGADLTAANEALINAKANRLKLEQVWEASKGDSIYGLSDVLNNKGLQANGQQRAELEAQYQQKLVKFKPSYPDMVQLKAQITSLDNAAKKMILLIRDSIATQYNVALQQEYSLQKQLKNSTAAMLDLQQRSIKYNILKREVDTNRSIYKSILQKFKEVGVAGNAVANNISIVDRAQLPNSPYSPRLFLNLGIALLFGLLSGVGLALLLEYVDNTLKSPGDVENHLGLAVLGLIPIMNDSKEPADVLEVLNDARSAFSEAYRSLHTALQFISASGMPRSLAVTSAMPGEGKSTSSIALAHICAKMGERVLLVDADMRKPSLHSKLKLSNATGLSNYLAGTSHPDAIIQKTANPNLMFMSSGPLPPDPAALLAGSRLASLVTLGAQFFDLLIIDCPPVLGLSDAPLIGSSVSGVCFVISSASTRTDKVRTALKRLEQTRTHVLGAVLTKFNTRATGYGDGYGYGYGYGEYSDRNKGETITKAKGPKFGILPPTEADH